MFEPVVENRENDDVKQSVIRFYSQMESFVSRYWYFRACDHASRKEWGKQRECLEAGLAEDPNDGDILIAMYRYEESDEVFEAMSNHLNRIGVFAGLAKAYAVFRYAIAPTLNSPLLKKSRLEFIFRPMWPTT